MLPLMQTINRYTLYIFVISFFHFPTLAQIQNNIEVQYEKCDCTNYSFTNHITSPYQKK